VIHIEYFSRITVCTALRKGHITPFLGLMLLRMLLPRRDNNDEVGVCNRSIGEGPSSVSHGNPERHMFVNLVLSSWLTWEHGLFLEADMEPWGWLNLLRHLACSGRVETE
jgi:hypothetical protein